MSRSQIQRLIKDGRVKGSAASLRSSTAVHAGQRFEIDIPAAGPGHAGAGAAPDPDHVPGPGHRRSSTSPPAWWCIPAAGHSSGTLVNALLHHVDGPERGRRRAASRDRPSTRSRHLRTHGRREERPGPPGAVAAVQRPRGREGIHRAGVGRRPGGPPDRGSRSDAIPTTARRCPPAHGAREAR